MESNVLASDEKKKLLTHVGCLILVLIAFSIALLILAPNTAVADVSGDYTYSIDGSPAVATITGYTGPGGSITIPDTLGGYSTVAIGDFSFASSLALTSVTIPGSIKSIGNEAFALCTSLTSVNIPESVNYIGQEAFFNCASLTSINLPSSLTSIGADAFGFCLALTSINVDPGNLDFASIDGVLYNKDITTLIQCPGGRTGSFTVPDGVISIGDSAFYQCVSLTYVDIPSSVATIGQEAFESCRSLTYVNIPTSVTSIGDIAFVYCSGLTSINVDPGNLYYASIDGVLYDKAITTLVQYPCGKEGAFSIPCCVTSIRVWAFYSCTSLTSVIIPNSVTTIGDSAFQACTSMTSISISSGVTSIGQFAFDYCLALISINVDPGNLYYASIDGVLYDKAITTLVQYPGGRMGAFTITDGVTSIGDGAFNWCTFLMSLTVPNGVASIGEYAFFQCTSLTSISFMGAFAPTNVGSNWIDGAPDGIRGHAYAVSNFPTSGNTFYGLTMGTNIEPSTQMTGWDSSATQLEDVSGASCHPRIAMDDHGNAIAVWQQYDGAHDSIYSRRYVAGAWQEVTILETGTGDAWSPQVSMDKCGNAVVVWQQYDGCSHLSLYARCLSSGVWGAVTLLETDSGDVWTPQVAMDDHGDAIVVWQQYDACSHLSLYAERLTSGVWGAVTLLEARTQDVWSPRIAMDGHGDAVVLWRQFIDSSMGIYARGLTSGVWGTVMRVDDGTGYVSSLQIAMDGNGHALVVWIQDWQPSEDMMSRSGVYVNRFSSGAWGTPTLLDWTDGNNYVYDPQIAMNDEGDAAVVWGMRLSLDRFDLHCTAYEGGIWGAVRVLTTPEELHKAFLGRVATDNNGNFIFMWSQSGDNPGSSGIYYATYQSKSWSAPIKLMDNEASELQIAMDRDGNAVAVWNQNDGDRQGLYAKIYNSGTEVCQRHLTSVGYQFNPPSGERELPQTEPVITNTSGSTMKGTHRCASIS